MNFFSKRNTFLESPVTTQSKQNQSYVSNPAIGYTLAQLRTNGGVYRYLVQSNFTNNHDSSFFYYNKTLLGVDTRLIKPKQNMIVEAVLHGTVLSDHNDDKLGNVQLASNKATSLQFILVCEFCKNVPLSPNKITRFNTTLDSLYFICNMCEPFNNDKGHDIEYLMENFPEYKNVKLVLNKKDFSATTLEFDNDDKRPEITNVEKLDINSIKISEENDFKNIKDNKLETETTRTKNYSKEQELESILEELNQERNTMFFKNINQ